MQTTTEPDTTQVVLDAIREVHALMGDDLDRIRARVDEVYARLDDMARTLAAMPASTQAEPEQGVTVEDGRMFLPGTGWVQS